MFLSQLRLDGRCRAVFKDLAAPYELHRTLCRAFPDARDGGTGRVLFRVEPSRSGQELVVLVQSERCPDWSQLPVGYTTEHNVREVVYSSAEDRAVGGGTASMVVLHQGARLRFRLLANPTVKRDGKRHGLLRDEEQRAWLRRKGMAGGFEVVADTVTIIPVGDRHSRRHDPHQGQVGLVTHVGVRFEGVLVVANPQLFVATLEQGIGSAKGFGFGLLSVAPVRD